VLVSQSLHELHIDYVINERGLDAAILMGRLRPGETDIAQVLTEFPKRAVYAVLAEADDVARLQTDSARLERIGSFVLPPGQVAHVYRITARK
jgi:hypothetical protein